MKRRARRLWTATEEEQLRNLYPNTPTHELENLFSRPLRQVYAKAKNMRLRKSDQYLESPHACRLRRGDNVGKDTRFKKGQKPWNTGMKGISPGGRSVETRFKPGQRGSKWVPIGSERISADGYLQRKVTDTGYPPRDWQAVHVLLWIEHNGPVPPGHTVVFSDGNKRNITIENLELISRTELMRRNTIHRYPPELREVIRLAGKLKRTIEKTEED